MRDSLKSQDNSLDEHFGKLIARESAKVFHYSMTKSEVLSLSYINFLSIIIL